MPSLGPTFFLITNPKINKMKIEDVVSGGGTNLQALIDYQKSHADCPYEIDVVISSTRTSYIIERAKNA